MAPKPKRPLSVWIAQIILGFYAFAISLIVLWGFFKRLSEGIPNPELYIVMTVGTLTFVAIFAGGVWGMAIRRPWGRWLGVAGLAILLIGSTIQETSRFVSDSESRFVSIGFLFSVFVVVGLAALAFMVGLGDASDAFFDGKSAKVRQPGHEDSDVSPKQDMEISRVTD